MSTNGWPMVPLGDLLVRTDEATDIVPTDTYREVTIRLWGKGVVRRHEIEGQQIAAKRRFVVRQDQFILSRIDARNGAFGLVPANLDGAIVSNDFPSYRVAHDRLLPSFLGWMSRTRTFVSLCQRASEGTTNRVRLQENRFLATPIPLPPLSQQRRIVAKIDQLAQRIDEAKRLREAAAAERSALSKSASRMIFGDQQRDWLPLGELVQDIENGWSPACLPTPATEGVWGVIKVGAVSFGRFDPTANKELPIGLAPKPQYEIKPGDFLMSRANTTELVGACALVGDTRSQLILCDKIFRFIFFEQSPMLPSYLDHVLKSPALRKQIESAATGTSPTMKNISKAKILQLRLPVPDLKEQERVVRHLDLLRVANTVLQRGHQRVDDELDVLLPSILDRAFKGEL